MARVRSGLGQLNGTELMQFVQDIMTAGTGNACAPTAPPTLATLQLLLDGGVAKINALSAGRDHVAMLLSDRDAHLAVVRQAVTAYIGNAEASCNFDGVKLQSLGLPLRSPGTPQLPCVTIMGLVTRTGDLEGGLSAEWDNQTQADSFELQISADPITPNSWTPLPSVSEPKVQLTDLPSGQKRWLRVRAFNRQGRGPWSDPSCRMIP